MSEKVDILIGADEAILAERPGSIGAVENRSATQIGTKHGKLFAFWGEIEITLSLDAFDSVGFKAPFDHGRAEFRETFRPFKFKPLRVLTNIEPLLVGTLIDVLPDIQPNAKSVDVKGYAKPGVLCDCDSSIRAGGHKLEFKNLNLKEIAQSLCRPFGIEVEFRGDPGAPFKKVSIGIDENIHKFLVELTKQRNYVMTNSREGRLLFWKSVTESTPVARFVQGVTPFANITPTFSPQDYYSEMTGFTAARKRKGGSSYTFQNTWLQDVFRPKSCKFDDTEKGDAPEATRAKVGRMFGNMCSYVIDGLPSWRDPEGNLWRPNTTVTARAPDAMIYRETELLIRNVKLNKNAGKEFASLEVVLPGAFSGEIPKFLPWDEP